MSLADPTHSLIPTNRNLVVCDAPAARGRTAYNPDLVDVADAELLALGRKFEAFLSKYDQRVRREAALADQDDAAEHADAVAALAKADRQLESYLRRIAAMRARTPAGLLVKLHAAEFDRDAGLASLRSDLLALTGQATGFDDSDAMLLELGREWDALYAEFRVLQKRMDDLKEVSEAAGFAAGISTLFRAGRDAEAWKLVRKSEEETGYAAARRACNAMLRDHLDPLTEAIGAATPRTLPGLVVKAKVADWFWDFKRDEPRENLDEEQAWSLNLIDSVLAFAPPAPCES